MSNLTAGVALTLHLGLVGEYNQVHPYARYTYDSNFIVGAYYNSEERVSGYIGYEIDITHKVSIELGVVSGYQSRDLLPMGRITYDDTLFIAPAIEYDSDNADTVGVVIGIQF